jgi:hypothetical protein
LRCCPSHLSPQQYNWCERSCCKQSARIAPAPIIVQPIPLPKPRIPTPPPRPWIPTESKAFTWELIRHTLSTQTCTDIIMWWVERSGEASESKAFTWELIRHTLSTQTCIDITPLLSTHNNLISVHVCVLSVCRMSSHVNVLLSDAAPLLSTHHTLISVHVCVLSVCRMSSHVNALLSDAAPLLSHTTYTFHTNMYRYQVVVGREKRGSIGM